jgi:hypothetical protein
MIRKVPAIVALILIASLSAAGCTVGLPSTSSPTPTSTTTSTTTSTPIQTPADYSSALTRQLESYNFIMEQPFTKSTNTRGNDVYKGVARNATVPGSKNVTFVIEKTKSKAEAKNVYNATVAAKLKEGYKANRTKAAAYEATKAYEEVWVGNYSRLWFMCNYGQKNLILHGWAFSQESHGSS